MQVGERADMLHRTTQDRYQKLRNVFYRLLERFNPDDLDDFIQTANALAEWIRHDDELSPEQKEALDRFVVPESLDWQICHQIANHQKHRNSTPRFRHHGDTQVLIPQVKAVYVAPGGRGFVVPPSTRVFGAGDEIVIECDGSRECALAFVVRTFRHFHYIFKVAPIPISERVPFTLGRLLFPSSGLLTNHI